MKVLVALCALIFLTGCPRPVPLDHIVSSDVDHFWVAYDRITATTDTAEQRRLLQTYYFDKGTPGLAALREARRYTADDYLQAIRQYPKYWADMRERTGRIPQKAREIQIAIEQFQSLYPKYRPATVYFAIGAFRTNGTAMDSMVLIGTEMAMADSLVDVTQLPDDLQYVKDYLQTNPGEHLPFLMVHEYVHTQQSARGGFDLLSQAVFEGTAEFIAELATGRVSPTPAIDYGRKNEALVKARFAEEMFSPFFYRWIWNNTQNEFGMRDLGYYVGYAIARKVYEAADDKQAAVARMIELEYNDPEDIEWFVEESGYFDQPLLTYKAAFREQRPSVTRVEPVLNDRENIDPDLSSFTVYFSEPLDTRFWSTGYGEGRDETFPEIREVRFAEDGRSVTYEVDLEPGRIYDFVINYGYRNERAIPLYPYPIRFKTRSE